MPVCYEWENGVKVFAYTRQMKGCYSDVDDYILGTKGQAQVLIKGQRGMINGEPVFQGDKPSMYDQEHKELFAAIRAGTPINNGRYMSLSTMMAIIGREACYTGDSLDWETALQRRRATRSDHVRVGRRAGGTDRHAGRDHLPARVGESFSTSSWIPATRPPICAEPTSK